GGQAEALLGLGDLLLQPGQVARRQGAETRLLGRLGGAGDQPLVLAEFQGEFQGCRPGRGHGSFSVYKVTGVLPAGDLYHLEYLAGYMVSNDLAQQRRGPSELRPGESLHAPAVCCSEWFGSAASPPRDEPPRARPAALPPARPKPLSVDGEQPLPEVVRPA